MLILNKFKIIIKDKEYYIDIFKGFYYKGNIDYYTYTITFYQYNKNKLFRKYKQIWEWNTNWIDYAEYNGDINKVINDAIKHYIMEKKYE